jgi:hypothetical protein
MDQLCLLGTAYRLESRLTVPGAEKRLVVPDSGEADAGTRTPDPLLTIGRKGFLLTREGPCFLDFFASRDCSGLVFGDVFPKTSPNSCPKSSPGNMGHRLCISTVMIRDQRTIRVGFGVAPT